MPDYKEKTAEGKQWQRCSNIIIQNRVQAPPIVILQEEIATNLGDETITKHIGEIAFTFNAEDTIALRDPTTGELVGKDITFGEVYVILWSLYMNKASARDEEIIAAAAAKLAEETRLAEEAATREAARVKAAEDKAAASETPPVDPPVGQPT